jgi:hypothetical protein
MMLSDVMSLCGVYLFIIVMNDTQGSYKSRVIAKARSLPTRRVSQLCREYTGLYIGKYCRHAKLTASKQPCPVYNFLAFAYSPATINILSIHHTHLVECILAHSSRYCERKQRMWEASSARDQAVDRWIRNGSGDRYQDSEKTRVLYDPAFVSMLERR